MVLFKFEIFTLLLSIYISTLENDEYAQGTHQFLIGMISEVPDTYAQGMHQSLMGMLSMF